MDAGSTKLSYDRLSWGTSPLSMLFLIFTVIAGVLSLLDSEWARSVRQPVLWGYVSFVIILGFFRMVLSRSVYPPAVRLSLLLASLAAWRTLALLWSVDRTSVALQALKTSLLAVFVLSVGAIINRLSRQTLEQLAEVIVYILVVATGVSMVQMYTREAVWHLLGQRASKLFIAVWGGSNIAGAAVMILGTLNWILINSSEKRVRGPGWIAWGLIWILMWLTVSRSAQVGFALANIVVFRARSVRLRRLLDSGVIVAFMVGVILLAWLGYEVEVSTSVLSLHGRTGLFYGAASIISGFQGFIGIGSGAWHRFATSTGLVSSMGLPTNEYGELIRGGVHNALLQTWVEDGLFGLAMYLAAFIVPVVRVYRLGVAQSPQSLPLLACLIAYFVRNMAESNNVLFGSIDNFPVFLSWLVLLITLRYSSAVHDVRGHVKNCT